MSKHLIHQIEKLKQLLLQMASAVEHNVADAIRALENRDSDLALKVIGNETRIDQFEVDVEEECLHALALYQPVASDLRFIASVLTINKDLERIGDLAVNLSEQAMFLAKDTTQSQLPFDLTEESNLVRIMLRKGLDAFVTQDAGLARSVLASDDEVDQIHRNMFRMVKEAIQANPKDAGQLIDLLMASRQLERIADHAVNIAADVVYMVDGAIVRHRAVEPRDDRT